MNAWTLRYFQPHELWDRETKIVQLAPAMEGYIGFGARIDLLREAWGKALAVNSCCRTAERNARVGGHPRSLHIYDKPHYPTGGTLAIDVAEISRDFRGLAWSMGFSIGLAKTFTHLDDRFHHPEVLLPQTEFHYSDR